MKVGLQSDWIVSLQGPPVFNLKFGPLFIKSCPKTMLGVSFIDNGGSFTYSGIKEAPVGLGFRQFDSYLIFGTWPPSGNHDPVVFTNPNGIQMEDYEFEHVGSYVEGINYGVTIKEPHNLNVGYDYYMNYRGDFGRELLRAYNPRWERYSGDILADFAISGNTLRLFPNTINRADKTIVSDGSEIEIQATSISNDTIYFSGDQTGIINKYDFIGTLPDDLKAIVESSSYNATSDETTVNVVGSGMFANSGAINCYVMGVSKNISYTPDSNLSVIEGTKTYTAHCHSDSVDGFSGGSFTTYPDINSVMSDMYVDSYHKLRFFVTGDEAEMASIKATILARKTGFVTDVTQYPLDLTGVGKTWSDLTLLLEGDGGVDVIGILFSAGKSDFTSPAIINPSSLFGHTPSSTEILESYEYENRKFILSHELASDYFNRYVNQTAMTHTFSSRNIDLWQNGVPFDAQNKPSTDEGTHWELPFEKA